MGTMRQMCCFGAGVMAGGEQEMFRIRVEGTEFRWAGNVFHAFDETYEIEAEHPAEAITKLLSEIEWGILDQVEPFTISVSLAEGALDRGDPKSDSSEAST